ncbi:MAG: RluA family pseudouridine synthase [Kiritimatiellales bacterium]|nr:RluA family pseudouridine synthase [Pontiella sp.]NNJ71038.1 RluA family pseudouridine synthase [Kiritimatiellales bacterium]
MQQKKPFKQPPKKFHPKGLTILYEDWDILVADKACGLLSVGSETVRENTAHYLLNDYVRKGNSKSKNRIYIVHRLDRDTSGILVFAKSEQAKKFLQDEWAHFKKKYYAVVRGSMPEKKGMITSFLAENSIHKMYSVSDPEKGKFARTAYTVLKESAGCSLVEVDLMTGRKNQIRVHLADLGCPVVGDKKYGTRQKDDKRLCLHAARLTITHPFTRETMTFETPIPGYFQSLLK